MTELTGFFTPWIMVAIFTLLHLVLPGRRITGYVKHPDTGELLTYRLNGRYVLATSILLWLLLGYLHWIPYNWFYIVRWYSLGGAFVLGLIFSILMVIPYPSTGKPWIADLYLGRLENPQFRNGMIDVKMWLYMIGAVMLQLNVLSFMAHKHMIFGELSGGSILCAVMLTWFVWDYLGFEKVHLYTYDIFAERVGIKLGWGCLTFYPYFYLIALWSAVHLPDPETPVWLLAIYAIIFLLGWILARGANMQKYFFKTQPERSFLGIKPEILSDGRKSLLVNGFWGVSRHINYLGEILMAVGIALSTGYPGILWVWLYPLYYLGLLLPRQYYDDKRCAAKYGDLWKKYTEKVKYRIIPWLY